MRIAGASYDVQDAVGPAFNLATMLTDAELALSDEHPRASYGLPIIEYRGWAYGPGDFERAPLILLTERVSEETLEQMRAAGWNVRPLEERECSCS